MSWEVVLSVFVLIANLSTDVSRQNSCILVAKSVDAAGLSRCPVSTKRPCFRVVLYQGDVTATAQSLNTFRTLGKQPKWESFSFRTLSSEEDIAAANAASFTFH